MQVHLRAVFMADVQNNISKSVCRKCCFASVYVVFLWHELAIIDFGGNLMFMQERHQAITDTVAQNGKGRFDITENNVYYIIQGIREYHYNNVEFAYV